MSILDKIGTLGALGSAFGMACCLPIFAAVGSAIGLSFLAEYEPQMNYLMQAAALMAAAGTIWSYRRHKSVVPGIVSAAAAASIIYSINTDMNAGLIYVGLIGLVIAAVSNALYIRKCGNCEIGGKA